MHIKSKTAGRDVPQILAQFYAYARPLVKTAVKTNKVCASVYFCNENY